MIVAVASRKASPGATTVAAQLAAHWYQPGSTRLLIEADASGGTLAARWSVAHGLTWDPGLLSLSTSRAELDPTMLDQVAQPLAEDVWVAAAPPAPDQIAASLARFGDRGASALAAAPDLVTMVDCGRLNATSPALTLARRAALTILVARPRLEEVHALVPAVAELSGAGCTLALACVGAGPYPAEDVGQALGIEVLGVLPADERAAGTLERDGLTAGRAYHRSPLARAADELADRVRARVVASLGSDFPVSAAVLAAREATG